MDEIVPQIRAARIAIVDRQGRDRIVIGLDADEQPQIQLLHLDGTAGLSLSLSDGDDCSARLLMGHGKKGSGFDVQVGADGIGWAELTSSPDEDAASCKLSVGHNAGLPEAAVVLRDGRSAFAATVSNSIVDFQGGPVRWDLRDRRGVAFELDDRRLRRLSDREREVLELMAEGLAPKQIASRLHVSPKTVRNFQASIYGKLGVSSALEAVAVLRMCRGQ